jgi:predicted nucleotidyltransferase
VDHDAAVAVLRGYFAGRAADVSAVYLFGSTAGGAARPASDVGVLLRVTPPATLGGPPFDIAADLERRLEAAVDVVVLNRAPADLRTLHRMVGFRDILVHGYDEVDLRVVEDVVANRLGDLLAFVAAVRARLGA